MGAYSDRVIADGASYYWRLGESAGTTAVDAKGTANGTISGGVTLGVSGALSDGNTAMTFNGTTGFIDMGNVAALAFTGAFSIECWFKTVAASGTFLVNKVDSGSGQGWALQHTTGSLTFYTYSTSGVIFHFSSSIGYNNGAWHHVAAVWDGTTAANGAKIYLDGVVMGQATAAAGTPAVNTRRFLIGATDLGGATQGSYFPGSLDEVAIYPRALSATEITAHFALSTAGTSNSFPFAYRIQPGGAAVDSFNLWEPITPSNTVDLPRGVSGGIWVGGGGDVAAVMGNNVMPIVFAAVPSGAWLPIAAKRINATGTTATGLVGLYEV